MTTDSDFLKQLRAANDLRGIEWNDGKVYYLTAEELLFRSNELGGETGELQNKVKKMVRHMNNMVGGTDTEQSRQEIADEAGDVIICVDRVLSLLGLDIETVTRDKFNKTSLKHGFQTKL